MDTAVALVESYLRVNGYFTVAEYPVLEAVRSGGHRMATDLDVLAVRFPGAGRRVAGRREEGAAPFEPDPSLGVPRDAPDMLIGEVKEGAARLNAAVRDPEVLEAALARFGCCSHEVAGDAARELLESGETDLASGHRARIVAFGTSGGDDDARPHTVVELSHVIAFVRSHLREHWDTLRHAQVKDPGLSFLMLLEKAGEES